MGGWFTAAIYNCPVPVPLMWALVWLYTGAYSFICTIVRVPYLL